MHGSSTSLQLTMDTTPPHTKPSIELNMSLLSGSPVPPARTHTAEETTAAVLLQQQDPMTQPHGPHEALLKEAVQWVRELETIRDDLHTLSVRNAILLDSLAMAGATEQMCSDDEQEEEE